MSIKIRCKRCGRKLRVDEKAIGRSVRCPGCKNVLTVPASPHAEERHREGASASERPPKSSRGSFRARCRAKKLKREVRDLRATLDQHWEKLGLLILESRPAEVRIHDELQALSDAQKQLKDREEALESVQEAKADHSVVKGLREEAKQLRDRQRELMIEIGRKAESAGVEVPGAQQQYTVVRRLRSMLGDKEERLRELERQIGPIELGIPARRIAKIVLVLALLAALAAGGYYAYSSGLFLRGIGRYKAWGVMRHVHDTLARCRESLSVAKKETEEFQAYSRGVLESKPLAGSRVLQQKLSSVLADLRKRSELPPSAIGEAVSRYRAAIEEEVQRIRSDFGSKQEEASRAVQQMAEDAEQLTKQTEEAGGLRRTFRIEQESEWGYLALYRSAKESVRGLGSEVLVELPEPREAGKTVGGYFVKCGPHKTTRNGRTIELAVYAQSTSLQELAKIMQEMKSLETSCKMKMRGEQREFEVALRSERDRLNTEIADYENLRQAQEAYLSGDYRKARERLEDIPQNSTARQQEKFFWKAAAEAARPDKEQEREGYVVVVWGGKIVANIGRESGLGPGSTLAVELSECPIVDPQGPDRVLGYDEMTIRVQEVRAKSSVCAAIAETQMVARPGDRVRVQKLRP